MAAPASAVNAAWQSQEAGPHRARKQWGQHFLTSRSILQRILHAAAIGKDDDVVEVGPGKGILTRELAKAARRVLAVEVDSALVARLQNEFDAAGNVRILQGDMLHYPPERLLPCFPPLADAPSTPERYLVVANLPYNIAAPTLRLFLEGSPQPSRLVVMVQHEVAKNIAAAPGDMGLLSVAVQYYGKPKIIAKVPPKSFSPAPKVTSAVICIDVYDRPQVDTPGTRCLLPYRARRICSPQKAAPQRVCSGVRRFARRRSQRAGEGGHRSTAARPNSYVRRMGTIGLCQFANLAYTLTMSITVRAYAKLNLTLEVLNRREDGYHEIASVMQSVSMGDTLTVAPAQHLTLECSIPELEK